MIKLLIELLFFCLSSCEHFRRIYYKLRSSRWCDILNNGATHATIKMSRVAFVLKMKMAVSVTIDQDWHSELICYQYLGGQKLKSW